MKMLLISLKFSILVVLSIAMFACSERTVTKGSSGQWVKGRALSINASFISSGRASFLSPLVLDVRNDSTDPVPITPMRAVGWFEQAGKLGSDYTFGDFANGSPMVSAVYVVKGPGGRTREASVDTKTPDITLHPGEEVRFSFNFWKSDKTKYDVLTRVRVMIGRDGSPQQEIFLIE